MVDLFMIFPSGQRKSLEVAASVKLMQAGGQSATDSSTGLRSLAETGEYLISFKALKVAVIRPKINFRINTTHGWHRGTPRFRR